MLGTEVVTNGMIRPTLLRYHQDGSLDASFQPDLADDVFSMAPCADGSIYVCTGIGIYTSVRRLRPNGTVDPGFDPFYVDFITPPPSRPVQAMVVQPDGKIIISAYPALYYALERTTNLLNRLNVDGSYDLQFGPVTQVEGEPLAAPPSALALQPDGRLLLVAAFSTTNGTLRNCLVRLTAAGQVDPTFSLPQITGDVQQLQALPGGKILINGQFTAINGVPWPALAVLNTDGSLDPGCHPAFPDLRLVQQQRHQDGSSG